MLEEALEHLVKGIVEHPDEVNVETRRQQRGRNRRLPPMRVLQVRVHPDDLGKVIGRAGRTAQALRAVMTALGGRGVRVDLVDTDEER